ncbi:hypothetical protein [Roseburia intestinalis]
MAAIPDCAKKCGEWMFGRLTNLSYMIDANGNISVAAYLVQMIQMGK